MCVRMLYVRMHLCKPENHLRRCSSGNFYFGFWNRLSHWPRLEEQARLAGPVSSRVMPVSHHRVCDALFCFESEFSNTGPHAFKAVR